MEKYEVKKHILSIIFTTLFLIGSTTYWYFNIYNKIPTTDEVNKLMGIEDIRVIDSLKQISDKDIKDLNSYNFNIKNTGDSKQIKIFIASNNNNISNNYIRYQINDNYISSLNMDGMIYLDNLSANESKEINIKIWISDTYTGNLDYHGNLIVI